MGLLNLISGPLCTHTVSGCGGGGADREPRGCYLPRGEFRRAIVQEIVSTSLHTAHNGTLDSSTLPF